MKMDECISREIAIKKLQMQLLNLEVDQDKGEYSELCENRGARDALDEAISDIREIKAADVQPVKHGHWIEEVREIGEAFRLYQTYIHCSECGKEHYSGTLPKPNFSDECGAKMDGKDGEQKK